MILVTVCCLLFLRLIEKLTRAFYEVVAQVGRLVERYLESLLNNDGITDSRQVNTAASEEKLYSTSSDSESSILQNDASTQTNRETPASTGSMLICKLRSKTKTVTVTCCKSDSEDCSSEDEECSNNCATINDNVAFIDFDKLSHENVKAKWNFNTDRAESFKVFTLKTHTKVFKKENKSVPEACGRSESKGPDDLRLEVNEFSVPANETCSPENEDASTSNVPSKELCETAAVGYSETNQTIPECELGFSENKNSTSAHQLRNDSMFAFLVKAAEEILEDKAFASSGNKKPQSTELETLADVVIEDIVASAGQESHKNVLSEAPVRDITDTSMKVNWNLNIDRTASLKGFKIKTNEKIDETENMSTSELCKISKSEGRKDSNLEENGCSKTVATDSSETKKAISENELHNDFMFETSVKAPVEVFEHKELECTANTSLMITVTKNLANVVKDVELERRRSSMQPPVCEALENMGHESLESPAHKDLENVELEFPKAHGDVEVEPKSLECRVHKALEDMDPEYLEPPANDALKDAEFKSPKSQVNKTSEDVELESPKFPVNKTPNDVEFKSSKSPVHKVRKYIDLDSLESPVYIALEDVQIQSPAHEPLKGIELEFPKSTVHKAFENAEIDSPKSSVNKAVVNMDLESPKAQDHKTLEHVELKFPESRVHKALEDLETENVESLGNKTLRYVEFESPKSSTLDAPEDVVLESSKSPAQRALDDVELKSPIIKTLKDLELKSHKALVHESLEDVKFKSPEPSVRKALENMKPNSLESPVCKAFGDRERDSPKLLVHEVFKEVEPKSPVQKALENVVIESLADKILEGMELESPESPVYKVLEDMESVSLESSDYKGCDDMELESPESPVYKVFEDMESVSRESSNYKGCDDMELENRTDDMQISYVYEVHDNEISGALNSPASKVCNNEFKFPASKVCKDKEHEFEVSENVEFKSTTCKGTTFENQGAKTPVLQNSGCNSNEDTLSEFPDHKDSKNNIDYFDRKTTEDIDHVSGIDDEPGVTCKQFSGARPKIFSENSSDCLNIPELCSKEKLTDGRGEDKSVAFTLRSIDLVAESMIGASKGRLKKVNESEQQFFPLTNAKKSYVLGSEFFIAALQECQVLNFFAGDSTTSIEKADLENLNRIIDELKLIQVVYCNPIDRFCQQYESTASNQPMEYDGNSHFQTRMTNYNFATDEHISKLSNPSESNTDNSQELLHQNSSLQIAELETSGILEASSELKDWRQNTSLKTYLKNRREETNLVPFDTQPETLPSKESNENNACLVLKLLNKETQTMLNSNENEFSKKCKNSPISEYDKSSFYQQIEVFDPKFGRLLQGQGIPFKPSDTQINNPTTLLRLSPPPSYHESEKCFSRTSGKRKNKKKKKKKRACNTNPVIVEISSNGNLKITDVNILAETDYDVARDVAEAAALIIGDVTKSTTQSERDIADTVALNAGGVAEAAALVIRDVTKRETPNEGDGAETASLNAGGVAEVAALIIGDITKSTTQSEGNIADTATLNAGGVAEAATLVIGDITERETQNEGDRADTESLNDLGAAEAVALIIGDVTKSTTQSERDIADTAALNTGDVAQAAALVIGDGTKIETPNEGDRADTASLNASDAAEAAALIIGDVIETETPSKGDTADAAAMNAGGVAELAAGTSKHAAETTDVRTGDVADNIENLDVDIKKQDSDCNEKLHGSAQCAEPNESSKLEQDQKKASEKKGKKSKKSKRKNNKKF